MSTYINDPQPVTQCDHPCRHRYHGLLDGYGAAEVCGACKQERWSTLTNPEDENEIPMFWSEWGYRTNPDSHIE